MGCLSSAGRRAALRRSRDIDRRLKEDLGLKLLLLGAHDSGKSTLLKQAKIIAGGEVPERLCSRHCVSGHAISCLGAILRQMDALGVAFGDPARETDSQRVLDVVHRMEGYEPLPEDLLAAMKRLWADPGVRESFGRRNERPLDDNAEYFLDRLDRLGDQDFVPSAQDAVRIPTKAAVIDEAFCVFRKTLFRLIDLAGLQTRVLHPALRKRLIPYFDDASLVVFCVAMSDFDRVPFHSAENRMRESLELFESICDDPWLAGIPIALFLNKMDVFEEKIKKSSLGVCFPEYAGGETSEEAAAFIQERFEARNKTPGRIRLYRTCAVDTDSTALVFEAVFGSVLSPALRCGHR